MLYFVKYWMFIALGFASVHTASLCPNGWLTFQGKCFLISNDVLTWHDAEIHCESSHGKLVEIENQWENIFLKGHLTPGMSYYIGATDISSEGLFKWQDSGKYLYEGYTDWCPNEPDDSHHNQDCLIFWTYCEKYHGKVFGWDDMDCSRKLGFICE